MTAARPDFQALARLICGSSHYPGLVEVLAIAAGGIAQAARAEAEAPTAADLHTRFKQMRDASKALTSALNDPVVLGYIDAAGDGPLMLGAEFFDLLNDLAARARKAPSAVRTVSGNKPVPMDDAFVLLKRKKAREEQGAGTEPKPENNGLSARQQCALVVYRAWTLARETEPGLVNSEAWQACNDLWQASGQPTISRPPKNKPSWDIDPAPRGWRDHLETAREVLTKPQAETHLHTFARGSMDRLFLPLMREAALKI